MTKEHEHTGHFPGWPIHRANTTYTPNQFFDVVVRNASRGCVRVVGYMLRRALGWCDENGNPIEEQLRVTYNELIAKAGVSRGAVGPAIQEALDKNYIARVKDAHPNTAGAPSQSGVYELRWNEEDDYTTDPALFRGFYFRDDGSCRTSVPNVFFDYFLPREPLSVIRVVSAVMRHSIGFGKGGERRKEVQLSVTDLERITGMTHRHVYKALVYTVQEGYVSCVEAGCIDLAGGGAASQKATYALHWTQAYVYGPNGWHHTQTLVEQIDNADGSKRDTAPVATVQKGQPVDGSKRDTATSGERFKKEHGDGSKRDTATVQKGARERFKKGHDIEIKLLKNKTPRNNTSQKQQQAREESAAAAGRIDEIAEMLIREGFNRQVAQTLAGSHPREVIESQIAWIGHRTQAKNRLGMLRRAIEENWEPPAKPKDNSNADGAVFAAHFYAGRAGNEDTPVAPPSEREIGAGEELVSRLREFCPQADKGQIARWGREFGQRVMEAERHQDRRTMSILAALRGYGDGFYADIKERWEERAQEARYDAEQQHYAIHHPAYVQFVRESVEQAQRADPDRYAAWLENYRAKRRGLGLHSEQDILWAFARELRIPDFWIWDKTHNHQPFMREAANV